VHRKVKKREPTPGTNPSVDPKPKTESGPDRGGKRNEEKESKDNRVGSPSGRKMGGGVKPKLGKGNVERHLYLVCHEGGETPERRLFLDEGEPEEREAVQRQG